MPVTGRNFLLATFITAVAMTVAAFAGAVIGNKWNMPPQIVIFGAGAFMLTALPLALLRRKAFDPDAPPRWMVYWLVFNLSVLLAALLTAAGILVETALAGHPPLAFRAFLVLLSTWGIAFLYGRTAINLFEIARRWPRRPA